MQIRSFHFIVAMVAGWLQREQGTVIEYLKEENRVLREHIGSKRIRFSDSQRRRLARKGKLVGRRGLSNLGLRRDAGYHLAMVPPAGGAEV